MNALRRLLSANSDWVGLVIVWGLTVVLLLLMAFLAEGLIFLLRPLPADRAKNLVELVGSLAWPTVALAGMFALLVPLTAFLRSIGPRITKISVFEVSIEVAELAEYTPTWSAAQEDVRKVTTQYVFDSASQTLFAEIADPSPADYAVVDLGDGEQWLTSRLYLFSIVLQKIRGLKAFVFLGPRDGNARCYIGTASTTDVRWALARRYPWFEASFGRAYADEILPPGLKWPPSSFQGEMNVDSARHIAQQFIGGIQEGLAPAPHEADQWVELEGPPQLWEKAQWIDEALLKEILGESLATASVHISPLDSPRQQARKIGAVDDTWVGLTKNGGVFQGLVDRSTVLQAIAVRTIANFPEEAAR